VSTEALRPLPCGSPGAARRVARRMALVTMWTLVLVIGWPASLPWLAPEAMTSPSDAPSGGSDARTITGGEWIRSAEAQSRKRRRRAARRNRRPAAAPPASDSANRPAADSAPGPAAPSPPPSGKNDKNENKVFDFTGLDISGQLRAPQLLYFLDRAAEELDRASLERRSFIPEMVQSIDEESL
jgi:hypothetical protein